MEQMIKEENIEYQEQTGANSEFIDKPKKDNFGLLKKVAGALAALLILIFVAGIIYKIVGNIGKKGKLPLVAEPTVKVAKKAAPTASEAVKGKVGEIETEIKRLEKKSTEIDFSEPIFSYPDLEMKINFDDER